MKALFLKSCKVSGIWIVLALLSTPDLAVCQEYNVLTLDSMLTSNTNLVYREDTRIFTVLSPGRGRERNKQVFTLLNSNAKRYRNLGIYYDKLRRISELTATVYDAMGNVVKEYESKDFKDQSDYDGFSVFSDNRLKFLSIPYDNYPFTIEYEYQYELKGLMFYPNHVFNSSSGTVESSSLIMKIPEEMNYRYMSSDESEPEESTANGYVIHTWTKENLPRIYREPYSPSLREQYIQVKTGPVNFEFGGIEGMMDSWDGLAKFQNQLNSSLPPLPEEKIKYVQELTATETTDEAKIEKVYSYLQDNFRYVSVQLGVGGWQPFSPTFVDENGFGDCKALSFYTKSLLEAVDIPAHYTLVSAGESPRPVDLDFPYRNFNHVILCVPNKGDTVWLECTSQTAPTGYAGTFTGNRRVLVVTDNGGKVVRTPKFETEDNIKSNIATVEIDENGNSNLMLKAKYKGLQYESDNLNFALHYSEKDQKEWLYKTLDIPDFEIVNFDLSYSRTAKPEAIVDLELLTNDFTSSLRDRLIVTPNLLSKISRLPPKMEDRTADIQIKEGYVKKDSVSFIFPENFEIEYLPDSQELESDFGSFSSEFIPSDNRITYLRTLILKEFRFSPERYQEFREFLSNVSEIDDDRFILKKK